MNKPIKENEQKNICKKIKFRPILATADKLYQQSYLYKENKDKKIKQINSEVWENNEWAHWGTDYTEYDQNNRMILHSYSNHDTLAGSTAGIVTEYHYESDTSANIQYEMHTRKKVGVIWETLYKVTYDYDKRNNITDKIEYDWKDDEWKLARAISYKYDKRNNILSETRLNWGKWNWENETIKIYEYDRKNNKSSMVYKKWEDGKWVNAFIIDYKYDKNGNVLSELSEHWKDGEIFLSRTNYEYDSNRNILKEKNEKQKDGMWVKKNTNSYEYDEYGNCVKIKIINSDIKNYIHEQFKVIDEKELFLPFIHRPLDYFLSEDKYLHNGNLEIFITNETYEI